MKKEETYQMMNNMLQALLEDEHDPIANLANACALLYDTMQDINWAGFYLYKNKELILGPFQGKPACMHIAMGNGVCGTAAAKLQTQRIANVHEFPTHIACDSASNSELVLPMLKENTLYGVLDIDSITYHRFDEIDEIYLQKFVQLLMATL